MGKYVVLLTLMCLSLFIDFYVYQGIKVLTLHLKSAARELIHGTYWGVTIFFAVHLLTRFFGKSGLQSTFFRRFLVPCFLISFAAKFFAALFLLLDDVVRALQWISLQTVPTSVDGPATRTGIARSVFLSKTAIIATAVPVLTMSYGIVYGAHDYRVRRVTVRLPHLPSAFHGLRIGQLSDIHSGSFFNKTSVRRGVAMLVHEKADIIFFTGDLVNNTADELDAYIDVFDKVKAPLGVYSTLGNHDYGDYVRWPSLSAKQNNYQAICAAHKQLGWHLLRNSHQLITQGSDQLAVMGVENWGTGGFSKYGRLRKAYCGTEDVPVRLLLSHDPSHWDAQVRSYCPDIDITFSGHTHGGQVGIEWDSFKWSPVQYRYKQWAGLYQEGEQYLYVNRGYGYIGYPGRIGILPEITIMQLEKGYPDFSK